MTNTFDLLISDYQSKQRIIEAEIERVLNDASMDVPTKIDKMRNLVEEISRIFGNISVSSEYSKILKESLNKQSESNTTSNHVATPTKENNSI